MATPQTCLLQLAPEWYTGADDELARLLDPVVEQLVMMLVSPKLVQLFTWQSCFMHMGFAQGMLTLELCVTQDDDRFTLEEPEFEAPPDITVQVTIVHIRDLRKIVHPEGTAPSTARPRREAYPDAHC